MQHFISHLKISRSAFFLSEYTFVKMFIKEYLILLKQFYLRVSIKPAINRKTPIIFISNIFQTFLSIHD